TKLMLSSLVMLFLCGTVANSFVHGSLSLTSALPTNGNLSRLTRFFFGYFKLRVVTKSLHDMCLMSSKSLTLNRSMLRAP
ncbi:hypothetical protein C0992_002031, partial [Termitomyces sp. T32_za158]